MGAIAFLLNLCTLPAGIRQIMGEVFINGRRILPDQLECPDGILVQHDASISTSSAGSVVFVIGRDVFLICGNSKLELKSSLDRKLNEISGFHLRSGSILLVFSSKKCRLRTITAVIGIRVIGVYLEADSEKIYVCTCFETSDLEVKHDPGISETVPTSYHD